MSHTHGQSLDMTTLKGMHVTSEKACLPRAKVGGFRSQYLAIDAFSSEE